MRRHDVRWAGPELARVLRENDEPRAAPLCPTEPGEFFTWLSDSPATLQYAEIRALFETEVGCATSDPYLDEGFVGLVSRLPRASTFYDNRTRGLFRHALAGLVPDALRLRPDKAGFREAGDEMLRKGGGLFGLRDLSDMRMLDACGVVNGRAYREDFDRLADAGTPVTEESLDLWPPLALEAFARAHAGRA